MGFSKRISWLYGMQKRYSSNHSLSFPGAA
jgi:hypothetical protein